MSLLAISGSQGTGKSTLISALGFPSIERKTSRSILADWNVTLSDVNNNPDLTLKFQDEILARKIADESAAVESNETWVTERTYADLFVYALVVLGREDKYSSWIDEYYERCYAAQSAYSQVCYLTAGHFQPVADGVRGSNKHYSRMNDIVMLDYTQRMTGVNLTVVTEADLQKRVDQIKNLIA